MTEERFKKLETIDGWTWVIRNRHDWDVWLPELKRYKEEHGDCLVPKNYKANPKLGIWCVLSPLISMDFQPNMFVQID